MNTLLIVLTGFLLLVIGALLALGVMGVLFLRRVIQRMDKIEDSLKNIKVEIVE